MFKLTQLDSDQPVTMNDVKNSIGPGGDLRIIGLRVVEIIKGTKQRKNLEKIFGEEVGKITFSFRENLDDLGVGVVGGG